MKPTQLKRLSQTDFLEYLAQRPHLAATLPYFARGLIGRQKTPARSKSKK